jgi:hypothetical protein
MPLRFPPGGYTKAAIDTSAQLESGHWFAIADGHGWNQFFAMPLEDTYIWVIIAGIVRNFYDRVYG